LALAKARRGGGSCGVGARAAGRCGCGCGVWRGEARGGGAALAPGGEWVRGVGGRAGQQCCGRWRRRLESLGGPRGIDGRCGEGEGHASCMGLCNRERG
jgi:hypothetical protein